MEKTKKVQETVIHSILDLYGLDTEFREQKEYINYNGEHGDNLVKIICSVLLDRGRRVVIKILHEQGDLLTARAKIEKQSEFSEFMRQHGIKTPMHYKANGNYCNEYFYDNLPCNVTVEDWCGEEIMEITPDIAYKIGVLLARMHVLSLENKLQIGCGTLFSAAYENDVDAFEEFCNIGNNENLDQRIVAQIKQLHGEKLNAIRNAWSDLPKAAVQGDISINNLVYGEDELVVFDYNNAGDEVLVSDLVLEGLLAAYEMDLPEGTDPSSREQLFLTLLDGYLSVRKLSEKEAETAWTVYTLYHSFWFTRVLYRDDSLEKLIKKEDYAAANRLLVKIVTDMKESNDGRFKK